MNFLRSEKTLEQWLGEYSVSHRHPWNIAIHLICVPAIYAVVVAVLYRWAPALILLPLFFYFRLGLKVFATMMIGVSLAALLTQDFSGKALLAIFIFAWVGQFVGHKIEGLKPSFFDDLRFLLIGPLWTIWGKKKYR